MVSMRVLKHKFAEGEKVLCYEPDPFKTKVLYDSKVLDIQLMKDARTGKKVIKFLIHFQGWNSTWDRFVTEDLILKDTEENRKLQRELAEKAQLTAAACGNLYRKHTKKKQNLNSNKSKDPVINAGLDPRVNKRCNSVPLEGTSGAVVASYQGHKPSENDEKSDDDLPRVVVNFVITPRMREYLENDHARIKNENRVVRLPATPNAVEILQMWMTEFIFSKIRKMCYKNTPKANMNKTPNYTIQDVLTQANLCHEVADGLRVYMDFMLQTVLLYDEERLQNKNFTQNPYIKIKSEDEKMDVNIVKIKEEKMDDNQVTKENSMKQVKLNKDLHKEKHKEAKCCKEVKDLLRDQLISKDRIKEEYLDEGFDHGEERRKSLRSRHQVQESPQAAVQAKQSTSQPQPAKPVEKKSILRGKIRNSVHRNSQTKCVDITELLGPSANKGPDQLLLPSMQKKNREFLKKVSLRKLLPEANYDENKPSFIYGAVHLARSLLKMPDLLSSYDYEQAKMTLLEEFLKNFMLFLEDHPEWFADDIYVPNTFGVDLIQNQDDQVKKSRLSTSPLKTSSNHQILTDKKEISV